MLVLASLAGVENGAPNGHVRRSGSVPTPNRGGVGETVVMTAFDSPPNGGRGFNNADWPRSPTAEDLPMSTPLRRFPRRGASLNGLRGLGQTDNAPDATLKSQPGLSPDLAELFGYFNRQANLILWLQGYMTGLQLQKQPIPQTVQDTYATIKTGLITDLSNFKSKTPNLPKGALRLPIQIVGDSLAEAWGSWATIYDINAQAPSAGLGVFGVDDLVVITIVAGVAFVAYEGFSAFKDSVKAKTIWDEAQVANINTLEAQRQAALKKGDTAGAAQTQAQIDAALKQGLANKPTDLDDPFGLKKLGKSLAYVVAIGGVGYLVWMFWPAISGGVKKLSGRSSAASA